MPHAEPAPPHRGTAERDQLPELRRVGIVGNVSVGKTSLFDRLCRQGHHAVNIPGSTLSATRGVLSVGPGAAPLSFHRACASCGQRGARATGDRGSPCTDGGRGHRPCPALDDSARSRWARWLRPTRAERDRAPDGRTAVTQLYDTPGSANLAAGSEDEMVARDLLLSGQLDSVLVVADAKNLRRSLALVLQVAELGLPLVVALNMMDEAENMGVDIDDAELARTLGVPVCRTVAVESRGIRRLGELLLDAQRCDRLVRFPETIDEVLARLTELLDNPELAPRALAMLLLSEDPAAARWTTAHLGADVLAQARQLVEQLQQSFAAPLRVVVADVYYAEAERIANRVIRRRRRGPNLLVRFGELAQRPWPGILIALGVVTAAYYWIGAFGATYVVDNLSASLFDKLIIPAFQRLVEPIPSVFVQDAIMDPDFGLLPTGLFLAIGIVLPVLFCFYLLQAVLEDSGYLPRLAVLFDRVFRKLGLNGQGLIPLVLGLSCVTMAVITTRMLPSRKERIILTLLVVGMPCAPLLAVMLVILGKLPWTAGAVVFALVALRILVAGVVASKLLGGRDPDLILEIPKMRIPRPGILLQKTGRRTWEFMREAVPVFLVASFVVFLFDRAGGLTVVADAARPVVSGWLGLPDQAVQVLIKTAIRRESGATELNLLREHFTNVQLVVTMLVMTFLLPCINAIIVIVKERGLTVGMAILGTVMVSAVVIGVMVNLVCRGLGVTFS